MACVFSPGEWVLPSVLGRTRLQSAIFGPMPVLEMASGIENGHTDVASFGQFQ
jgi:hypothetical protein